MSSIIRATTTSGLQIAPDNSGSLQLQTNGTTTAVTIDTSQNVLVGATSLASGFSGFAQIEASGSSGGIVINSTANNICRIIFTKDNASGNEGLIRYNTSDNGLEFFTNATKQAQITSAGLLQFNSGYGSVATAYGCRAWVNFNGTGTVAIRASGNVSSITDNGTGDYTVNFTNAMPDANYAVSSIADDKSGSYWRMPGIRSDGANAPTTSSFKIKTDGNIGGFDIERVLLSVFR